MSYLATLGAGLRGEGYNLKPFIDTLESRVYDEKQKKNILDVINGSFLSNLV